MIHTASPADPRAPLAQPTAAEPPLMRVGVEDRHHRLRQVIEVHGLVEAVRLFERLRDLGLQCGPGRRVNGLRLARVFVPLPATCAGTHEAFPICEEV